MSLSRFAALSSILAAISLAPVAAQAAFTHTTSNLNLRAGPGTHYPVRKVIPAGAEIDVHSCGHTWCYTAWAGHQGYVSHDYLIHHVAVVVTPIVHVTNVHYHSIF
jgi:uncharacterized protein YraI